jgi:hypothetical protein
MKNLMARLLKQFFIAVCIYLSAACATAVKHEDLPALFPNALIAEPIKLRTGYVHTTQPFDVTNPAQVWEVNLGFVRKDDALAVNSFFCLVDSRKSMLRAHRKCNDGEPALHVKWELLRDDQFSAGGFEYDAKSTDTNSQSSRADYLLGLGAFSKQAPGRYRIRITILADIPELDITTPHLVIAKPFFNRQR